MKVVINKCYGGFGLSPKAVIEYGKMKGMNIHAYSSVTIKEEYPPKYKYTEVFPLKDDCSEYFVLHYATKKIKSEDDLDTFYFSERDIDRNDPCLVAVVENMKEEAYGPYSKLEIVDVPDDVKWLIEEYDGMEHISEAHRTWG